MSRHGTAQRCPLEHGTDDDGNPVQAEAAPGLLLCRRHVSWLERDISELAGLYDDLTLRLHPSSGQLKPFTTHDAGGTPTVNRMTGEEESAAYINGAVADHRALIVSTMASWVLLVAEERGVSAPRSDPPDPHALGAWLGLHIEWMAAQMWADEPAGHFRELSRRAFNLAYPSGRRRLEIAPCGECTGTLITHVSRTADLLPEVIWCDTCGRKIPPPEWRQLRKTITGEDSDVSLTVAQASDVYGVPVSTLYRWISDGTVATVSEDPMLLSAVAIEGLIFRSGVLRDTA